MKSAFEPSAEYSQSSVSLASNFNSSSSDSEENFTKLSCDT